LVLAVLEGASRLLEKPRPPKPEVADYLFVAPETQFAGEDRGRVATPQAVLLRTQRQDDLALNDEGELNASISAFDHALLKPGRLATRTMSPPSPPVTAPKKSPRVTPTAVAIFCIELMDGETCPFSTCDMKLGEKPDCLASVRTEIPAWTRRRRTCSPTPCYLRSGAMVERECSADHWRCGSQTREARRFATTPRCKPGMRSAGPTR
jgi:hypothetical protein